MAVPKKRTSKSKTRSRKASAWLLKSPSRSLCPNCGQPKLPHRACGECGTYKGRVIKDIT